MSTQVNSLAADCRQHALSAAYYADAAAVERIEIVENAPMARDTYRLRLKSPQLASRITPGQFLMLRIPNRDNPLLARPFALYDVWQDATGNPLGIDVGYLVVGRMTRLLSQMKPSDELEYWGPLGNGFPAASAKHLVMVAGGIGQTPFLALGREALGGRRYGTPQREAPTSEKATLCYGVRTAEFAAGVEDFRQAGVDVRLSSNDGSLGQPGLVTELLNQTLDESNEADCRIVCCGPEPMMEAVAKIAAARGVPCQVSLETPMACGIGICFSCVAKVMQPDGEWDYKRTCVEGPVFDAERIVW